MLYVPLAGAAYKCVDERGLTHVGDTPPAGCAKVVMYEVKPNGTVIRRIDPTPTPDQVKAMQAEQERKREADKLAAEQKRKDAALLSTYSSEREFEVVLDRTVSPIRARMASAHERIVAIDARQRKIEEEMEFYKAGKRKSAKGDRDQAPPSLVAEQERLFFEKQSLVNGLAAQEKEIRQLEARSEADRRRWVSIKGGRSDESVPTSASADARSAGKAY
jgi:hypothetical protein